MRPVFGVQNAQPQILNSYFESSEKVLSEIAILQEKVTCSRRKVSAILARKGQIVMSSHNGPISEELSDCKRCQSTAKHQIATECAFDHAEARCCRTALPGDTLFTSTSPCGGCAQLIIQAGIATVLYLEQYPDSRPLEQLLLSGVSIYHIKEN